jgi:tetratricopeptide (TPR) repeat protein
MAARGWRAGAYGGDGKVEAGIEEYEQAVSRARLLGTSPPANVLTLHALSLYWLGRLDEAVERSRAGVEAARGANDASVLMYSLSHLGLSLASIGRYGEADEVFHEARQFGREYRLHSLLSRAIAMSAGFRVDLGDFAHAEELSNEARDLALSANWPPTAASANIDLLFNFARRGEIERAENLLAEVAGAVEKASGFHGWLWRLRLAQARAELAVGRGDWAEAATFATDAIAQARERGRRKYESAGLHTRARALIALGRADEASGDLEVALKRARETGDPALFLRVAATRLAVAPDEQLAGDAAAVSARVAQSLPDGPMRQAFATSAW